jgi:hypothetical protein
MDLRHLRFCTALAGLGALLAAGCSSGAKSSEDETTMDFRHIVRAYDLVLAEKRRPPRDVSEIEKVLTELHEADLNPPAKDVLISSRDGEPYVIIMGADLGATRSSDILAYEKRGAEGKRYVLLMSYDVQQLTDEEFANATFTMGHKPAGG